MSVAAIAAATLIGGRRDGAYADALSAITAPPPARIRVGRATFDFPAVGVLSLDGTLCTGTLIGCRTVLTAGHCVCRNGAASCVPSGEVAPDDVHLFFQHGGFAAVSAVDAGFDIDLAVVTLAQPITGILPARLNPLGRPARDAPTTIAGFGTEEFVDLVPQGVGIKRTASVELTSCGSLLADAIFLCANATDADDPGVCQGDSGGPLLANTGAGSVVAGVAASIAGGSGVMECIPPFTQFFTDVMPWRAAINTAAAGDVSSEPCGDLPPVGSADVTVYPFTGELTASVDEVGGEFEVAPGIAVLRVTMNGALVTGTARNNFDLFVEHAGECGSICSDTRDSAFGACEIAAPAAGSWRVRARRLQGEGEVQVTVTLFNAGGAATEVAGSEPPPRINDWHPGGPHDRETSNEDGTTSRYIDGRLAGTEPALLHQLDSISGCVGDCDGCGSVSIDELVQLVNIALGTIPMSACSQSQSGGPVTISALVQAVNAALSGCPPA